MRDKNHGINCAKCGLFCKPYDEFTPFGCNSCDPLEPLDPFYICKQCYPSIKQIWINDFKKGSRCGDWQKSKAEREAAKECGLAWVHSGGIGTLGTKDFADSYKYIPKAEFDRLSKLPYYGYCKVCGAENKGGYCSNKNCVESFEQKFGEKK